jgi:hypothetical protein
MTALYRRLLLEAELEREFGWADAAPNSAPSPAKREALRPECALMWVSR